MMNETYLIKLSAQTSHTEGKISNMSVTYRITLFNWY